MIEIAEILNRWTKRHKIKEISKALAYSKNTIKNIIKHAIDLGFTIDNIKDLDAVARKIDTVRRHPKGDVARDQVMQSLRVFDEEIKKWLGEKDMTFKQIKRLINESGHKISYTSLRRYLHKNFQALISQEGKNYTMPLFSKPGEEAQVDYGYVGLMQDPDTGNMRKTWAFIMTLSYSRYRYVEFTFKQDYRSWIQSHINAFKFFGGVPERILIDNLKAGVIKSDIYDTTLNKNYAELARFYDVVIDPAKVRDPKAKGKVERSVPMVRQQLIAGRVYSDINAANIAAFKWCKESIANEVTRTTGKTPAEMFALEKEHLKPQPEECFDIAQWQLCKVNKNHHIVCKGNFYSLPTEYIGSEVSVRSGLKTVNIYHDNKLIKTHLKKEGTGNWITDTNDYPQGSFRFISKTKEEYLKEAQELGASVYEFLNTIFIKYSKQATRKACGILSLADKYGKERLADACAKALIFENYEYQSLVNCLEKGLEKIEVEAKIETVTSNEENSFLRPANQYTSSTEIHCV